MRRQRSAARFRGKGQVTYIRSRASPLERDRFPLSRIVLSC
jgi:hypothetical protein